jgi:hypothetical protein
MLGTVPLSELHSMSVEAAMTRVRGLRDTYTSKISQRLELSLPSMAAEVVHDVVPLHSASLTAAGINLPRTVAALNQYADTRIAQYFTAWHSVIRDLVLKAIEEVNTCLQTGQSDFSKYCYSLLDNLRNAGPTVAASTGVEVVANLIFDKADRMLHADYGGIVAYVAEKIKEMLADCLDDHLRAMYPNVSFAPLREAPHLGAGDSAAEPGSSAETSQSLEEL